ncbi:MAG TPA: OmpA family protein [Gammaproteobacteria bacterium]|nr:OmpA family protein [Gammaproteobacteria bacterium]
MGTAAAGTTPPGTVISNTGSLAYQVSGGGTHTQQTNTVNITTVAANRTPSSVIFLDYAPGSSDASSLLAGPTLCSTNGGSTFNPLPNPGSLNVSNPLALAPTSMYNAGDPLFIELTDHDQNIDPTVRDTVLVAVSVPSLHESVVLKLTETGVNTGVFVGYVLTGTSNAGGCSLQVGPNTTVDVNYVDISDASDKSSATALVDPFDVVFDSTSGKRLDGAKLTLVDANTGKPVPVLGRDGVSTYPSTVTSGTTVTDSAGEKYDMPAGGFLFPVVKPGNYRVQVEPPQGYHAPSVVSAKTLEALSGAPYILPSGSYGGTMGQKAEGVLQLDMPLDPISTKLLLQKTVSTATASVGDIIQYSLTLQNVSTTLAAEGVQVVDVLPQGLRYVKGSARLASGATAAVSISPTGQQLTITAGSVPAKGTQTVEYAVEITAATPLTTVINTAQAFEDGVAVSNQATAGVEVQSEFLQNVNTLVGRVVVGCDSQGTQGVEKARVVMEDGSYAITDKHGDYHFQAITNGTHVVQLDLASLPKGYEPMSCEQNTRWAGRDYSQFVEVHGGALWRADFHVRPIPGAQGDLSLQLTQAPAIDHVHNTLQLTVSDVPVTNLSTTVMLPAGMTYLAGTARLDGQKIDDPQDAGGGMLIFRTGAHAAGWKGVLEFDTVLPAVQGAAPPAAAHQTKSFTIEGFPSGKVEMSAHDQEVMQQIADLIKGAQNISMTFVGYTDAQPLTAGSKYANNMELSIARAQAVADYLQAHIDVDSAQVFISGRGSNDPVASNATEAGRNRNRRTQIDVVYDEKGTSAEPTAVNNSVFQTRALASFDAPSAKGQHTAPAAVVLHAVPGAKQEEREFTLQDFASGSTELSAHDQDVMQQVAALLKGASDVSLTFVGYTDDTRVAAGSRYANNMELSIARAKTAADYVTGHLPVDGAQVFIVGRGNDATADGGDGDVARNRRIVIKVQYSAAGTAAADAGGQSTVQHAAIKGLSPADMPDAKQQDAVDAAAMADTDANDDQSKLADQYELDPKWLETQADGKPQFVWPTESFLPAIPAIHVAVEHAPGQKAVLYVNGQPVSMRAFLSVSKNRLGTAAVSQWLGVPLTEGDNDLTAEITQDGKVVQRVERRVHYSGVPVRAEFLADQSKLLADGRVKPVFAVRFFDRWGYPARRGLIGKYQVDAPFVAYQSVQQLQQDQVSALSPREPTYTIGEGGIAYIHLMPTTTTGEVTVTVPMVNDTYQQLHGWMRPAARDWILVGVASGTAAFDKIKNNMQSVQGDDPNSDIYQDGRVAFYAKGTIQGDFLLTASYDSAKAGGVGANGLQQAVNPNTYFMLYGDAAQQGFDAQSASKLYVKIERNQFYALFGDYNTGLTVTELSAYDRMFNGVKSAYQGDNFGYTAFAAQNNQAYVKDEIQGNGTSGLYHLSHQQLLIDSERVVLETRDRYTNAVLSTQSLTPFVDYTLDYFGGTIFFKDPVAARDSNFNPIYIVVQYEVTTGASNAISTGGRASIKSADGKVELGATVVNEGTGDGNNRLTGTDLRVQVTPSTTLKAEVAHTANGPNGASSTLSNVNGVSVTTGSSNTSNASGNAYSVELKTQSLTLENDIYVKDEAPTFGLGQQSLGDAGMRRFGDDTRYHLDQNWSLLGQVQRQQSIAQDSTSDVANGGVQYKFDNGSTLGAGLQHAQESYPNATPTVFGGTAQGDYSSNQAYVNGTYGLTSKVVLRGSATRTLGGEAADPQYPNLYAAGVDYKLTDKTALFVNEQSTSGTLQSDRTTEFGVKTQPWDQAQVSSSVSQEQTEYGPRLFSTVGLTQGWQVNKELSLEAGYDRVASMHQPSTPVTTAQTATAPATGAYTSDFNSMFLGASYHQADWAMNGRAETLNSDQQTTRNLFAGFYRTLGAGVAFSASLQGFHSDYAVGGVSDTANGRLGFAYRPDESRWSWLEQLDLVYASQEGLQGLPQFASATGTAASQESAATLANDPQTVATYGLNMRTWKIVNNLQQNYAEEGVYQFSLYYGSKWARFAFDTGSYQGYTDLMGVEYRYDIRPKWDLGFMVNRIHSYGAGVTNRSYGIETGWDIGTNMWLSLGYNFSGFYDQDFTADHYTAQGLFLRFRFKFDQDTVKSMASAGKLVTPP